MGGGSFAIAKDSRQHAPCVAKARGQQERPAPTRSRDDHSIQEKAFPDNPEASNMCFEAVASKHPYNSWHRAHRLHECQIMRLTENAKAFRLQQVDGVDSLSYVIYF